MSGGLPLPEGLSLESFLKFADRAREGIADSLDSAAIQTLSAEEVKLLSPSLITTLMTLCAMDYCTMAKGLTVDQYIHDILLPQAEALAKVYPRNGGE